jgi:hypothetical protein
MTVSSKHHLGIIFVLVLVMIIFSIIWLVFRYMPAEIFKGEVISENISAEVASRCRWECGDFISGSPQFVECFAKCAE